MSIKISFDTRYTYLYFLAQKVMSFRSSQNPFIKLNETFCASLEKSMTSEFYFLFKTYVPIILLLKNIVFRIWKEMRKNKIRKTIKSVRDRQQQQQ